MKILAFAAHPDDDILGCGGMIAKRVKEGATVRVEFIAEARRVGSMTRMIH